MKSLKQFITEQQINEFLLSALAIGAVGAFVGKIGKSLINGVSTAWNGIFESSENTISEKKEEKKDFKSVYPLQVPDEEILNKCIQKTNPKAGVDGKGGAGLWTIEEKIKKNPELKKVNKGEYKPNYAAFVTDKKDIAGLFGFSTVYWKNKAKKADDANEKKLAKKYQKYMHIFDIDICPEFDEKKIYPEIWKTFDAMLKELKGMGITIKYDNDNEKVEYIKHGFEEIEGIKGYLAITSQEEKANK